MSRDNYLYEYFAYKSLFFNTLAKMGGLQSSVPHLRGVPDERLTTNDERLLYSVRLNNGTANASVTTAKIDR